MSRRRAGWSSALVAGLAAGVLFLPIPVYRQFPLVIEPVEIRHVYTSTPGTVAQVHVRPGQRVRRGDVLLELDNFLRRDHHHRLRTAREIQRIEVSVQQALGDAAQEALARASLNTIEEQLNDDERQLSRLVLRAPCDGVVIGPPVKPEPPSRRSDRSLPRWSGTPLEARNLGAWLDAGVHVLSIAPAGEYRATLLIPQQDRHDLASGQDVRIALENRPGRTCRSHIRHISERHVETAPPALTRRFGGELDVLPGSAGREQLASAAYQAAVPIPRGDRFLPGMRGAARITVRTRTAGAWLWRIVCTTLRFRL